MKSKLIFFAIILLMVSHLAYADWQIQFDSEADRVMHMGGNTLRGNFATKGQCQSYQNSRPAFEQNHSKCVGYDRSSSGSTGYSGDSSKQQIQQMIFQSLFDSLFAPPPDTSAQDEKARQDAIKRQQEEEQKKQAALERWRQFQTQEELQRKMEQEDRIKQGEKVLSQMQTVGGGKLEPFSFGNPKLDLKPIGQTYPAPSTAWEQALCAAYFSNMAKQSTKDVDARFYADQAESVMFGGSTYVECKIPKVSNEKLAKRMEEVRKIYDEMNVKIKDLQDIEYKISESKEKIKNAELKKEEATTKLNELQNRAVTAKPEEKAEVEDLAAMAQKQLQDAEQELDQAKQSENDMIKEKEKAENELKNMNAKIQAGSE
ncbi:MAG: hypothetical protein AAB065_06715 [Deltaproteobacteria bacterium]